MIATNDTLRSGDELAIRILLAGLVCVAILAAGLLAEKIEVYEAPAQAVPAQSQVQRCVVWVWPTTGGWLDMYAPLPCADAELLANAVRVAIANGSRPDLARVVVLPEGVAP